jgi:hypothetical protein
MNAHHRSPVAWWPLGLLVVLVIGGCAGGGFQRVKPTQLNVAQAEVPEDQLLDVGVRLTALSELSESKMKKQGTREGIRESERVYFACHLKETLERSSHWGNADVVPAGAEGVDVLVKSELVESTGERMKIRVDVVDATGRVWLDRNYYVKAGEGAYGAMAVGQLDALQDLYNKISNDIAAFKYTLTADEIRQIRTVAKLRFAQAVAPDIYAAHLVSQEGRYVVQRLPADSDAFMQRVEQMRARNEMFMDVLDQHYEGFYTEMWDSYRDWREANMEEQIAKRKAAEQAFWGTLAGIAIAAGSAYAGSTTDSSAGQSAAAAGVMIGSGIAVSSAVKGAQMSAMHAQALEEIATSFESQMRPSVVELEGKQYELTGTDAEKRQKFMELLRAIYFEERGFDEPAPPEQDGAELPATQE